MERSLREEVWKQIREMQERHRIELEPLIKILSSLQSLEPPQPIIINIGSLTESQQREIIERLRSSGVQLDETKK